MDLRVLFYLLNFLFDFLLVQSLGYPDPYIQEAKNVQSDSKFDYIIVGGGATGCPLASTLSHKFSVLLLERGGNPYGNPSINRIEGFPSVVTTPAVQSFRSTDGVKNRRANVLGGGSSINAGFYSRAPPEFIEAAGWNPEKVQEAYEWIENQIVFFPKLKSWNTAFRDGLLQAEILPYNGKSLDHLIGTKVAGSLFDENGYRHTAADLLRAGNSSNLSVYVHAYVQKLLFDPSTRQSNLSAVGVSYVDENGNNHDVYLNPRGEILLSAGAIGSSQLLMLSGIGPKDELNRWNVSVLKDLAWVGQNMTDIPVNYVNVLSPLPVEESSLQVVGITPYGNIIEGASGGNHTMSLPTAGDLSFLPPTQRSDIWTDAVNNVLTSFPPSLRQQLNQAGFILHKVYNPLSKGKLQLSSSNIKDHPILTFNYFSQEEDVEACVNGTKYLHKLLNSSSFSPFKYAALPQPLRSFFPNLNSTSGTQFNGEFPTLPNSNNYTQASQWCKDTISVICHFYGGCLAEKCIDANYKLLGVNFVRVIDGSTWLTSPGTNPMATCLMLGRYMGLQILKERRAN